MSIVRRVNILAGAGLVHDAGLPMSVGLVTKLGEKLHAQLKDPDATNDTRKAAATNLTVMRLLEGGVRFQEGILDRDPSKPVNIEQLAVAAIQLATRNQHPASPFAAGWHHRVTELEREHPGVLSNFVDSVYLSLRTWLTATDAHAIAYLAHFADFADQFEGLDFFTLNYDLCVERALTEHRRRSFMNGFSESGWQPDLLAREPQENGIRIFKLHGSLDWIEAEGYPLVSLEFPRWAHAEEVDPEHRPLLIFGTNQKLSAKQPFLSLAYHFSQAVLNGIVLVVIGYSFGDEYINQIIFQGIQSNPKLRLVVVAPSADEYLKAHELLANRPSVRAVPLGASTALNEGRILGIVRELLAESGDEEPF